MFDCHFDDGASNRLLQSSQHYSFLFKSKFKIQNRYELLTENTNTRMPITVYDTAKSQLYLKQNVDTNKLLYFYILTNRLMRLDTNRGHEESFDTPPELIIFY